MEVIESDRKLLEDNGWVVECDFPFEIRMTEDGETMGFASGHAADMVLDSLKKGGSVKRSEPKPSGNGPQGVNEEGTVRKWLEDKGFGFIVPDGNGEDVFVHQSVIDMEGFRKLEEGQRVGFKSGIGKGGKIAAEWCRLI